MTDVLVLGVVMNRNACNIVIIVRIVDFHIWRPYESRIRCAYLSSIASVLKWDFLYSCTAVNKISSDIARRAIPLLVFFSQGQLLAVFGQNEHV